MRFTAVFAIAAAVRLTADHPSAAEIFTHVDANNDGKVTWAEAVKAGTAWAKKHDVEVTKKMVKKAKKMFMKAAGDDKKLTLKELKAAMEEASNLEFPSAEEIFSHVDTNKDGFVTLKEAAKAAKNYCKEHNIKYTDKDVEKAKNMFLDAAGTDKKLTLDELKTAIAEHSDVQVEELPTADQVLEHCDANDDGSLNYKEAKACLTAAVKGDHMTAADAKKAGDLLLKNAHITKATFVAAAQKDFKASAEQANEIFGHVDSNNNGSISYDEAKAAVEWAVENGKLPKNKVKEAKRYLSRKATIGKAGIAAALSQWE